MRESGREGRGREVRKGVKRGESREGGREEEKRKGARGIAI